MSPTDLADSTIRLRRREWTAIGLLTFLGGLLRIWGLGTLGLNHFDEGVYAFAGLWVLAPGGLLALNPMVVPYAPPGFPILLGLSFWVLGFSAIAAVLVSILTGTASIAAIGILARRLLGPGAGATASALAAVSGPHITFSRTSLTDASALLAWLLALLAGSRWLERPTPGRALSLGFGIGIAQLFKYQGWLTFVIIGAAWAVTRLTDSLAGRRPTRSELIRDAGQLTLAAVVALTIYAPWILFVERHGGYAHLLAHHRSYLDGPTAWPRNTWIQILNAELLSGPRFLGLLGAPLALVSAWWVLRPRMSVPALIPLGWLVLSFGVGPVPSLVAGVFLGLALGIVVKRLPPLQIVWWAVMVALTPLYHPYARLALPAIAASWLLTASALVITLRSESAPFKPWTFAFLLAGAVLVGIGLSGKAAVMSSPGSGPTGLYDRSDYLAKALEPILDRIETKGPPLLILARQAIAFELASHGIKYELLNGPEDLKNERESGRVALVDSVHLMIGGVELDEVGGRWSILASSEYGLDRPTWLDLDPGGSDPERKGRARIYLLRNK